MIALAAATWACGQPTPAEAPSASGVNPSPVHLVRPAAAPLSPVAEIGRAMFFDTRLSGPGTMSCATCHSPAFAYGPPNNLPVQFGGVSGHDQGARAVPSLRYVDRIPEFGIGPDRGDVNTAPPMAQQMARGAAAARPRKTAGASAGPPPMVPRGGLFWDGRAGSLQVQAASPLLNPAEMANADTAALVAKIRALGYATQLVRALGAPAVSGAAPERLLDEALFALARFQFEDPSFHPYNSRYDRWLEGQATLAPAELRGLRVFDDPAKGNCAACHIDRPGPDGRPPAFTDWQYEALGVPRNDHLAANDDPRYFDLGLCGPSRTDLAKQPRWCGMFRTPSLRNVATRRVFFHNGVYHALEDVLRFYNFRDTRPELVYPVGRTGQLLTFDDLPAPLQGNVDVLDAPFGRRPGDPPPMTDQDIADVVRFLQTLTDEPGS